MTETSKIIRCSRCNRRMRRAIEPGRGEWNATFVHGVLTGYLCPDCQTPEENTEAVINEATGSSQIAKTIRRGEPEFAEAAARHVIAVANDIWRERLQEIVASGQTGAIDPTALADRTTARVQTTLGIRPPESIRKDLAEM